MEKMNELWAVVESPLQMEILVSAIRNAQLMGNTPYYRSNEKGSIYEVLPNGKSVSPLVLAILMDAPAEKIKFLLQEQERKTIEWRSKNSTQQEAPKNDEVVE
jgi:hypothetical protein